MINKGYLIAKTDKESDEVYTPPASTERNGFIDACYKKDNY